MCNACPTLTRDERRAIHEPAVSTPAVPAMNADYIVWFQDYRPADKGRVGGKNSSLGEMIAAGLPVPPGLR